MGGPGSGRRPDKRCVSECRVLSVGELAARSRRQRKPTGEIAWVAKRSRVTLGPPHLHDHRGALAAGSGPLGCSPCATGPPPSAAESRERIILVAEKPGLAYCPNCDEPRAQALRPTRRRSTSSVGAATISSIAADPDRTASPSCRPPWVHC